MKINRNLRSRVNLRVFLCLLLFSVFVPSVHAHGHTPADYPALGTPEFPGLCAYRGHIGKYQCLKVSAKKHDMYMCKGKDLHYSKVNGKAGCYKCPKGYSRYSPTRKMNHKKACTKRKSGKNEYAKAKFIAKVVKKCPKGQFKHKGRCSSCPKRTKRQHAAGLDTGYCKVDKAFRCNKGLTLHKSQPKGVVGQLGNLVGLKYKKYCGIPFSLKQYGKDILASDANEDVLKKLGDLGKALARNDKTSKRKIDDFKKAVKQNRLKDAYDIMLKFKEFEQLVEVLTATNATAQSIGGAAQQFTITVGHVGDVSLGLGASYEWGVALDYAERKVKKYKSYGKSKGLSAGADGGTVIGVWKGAFKSGYSQGYVGAFSAGSFGGGVGVWSDYYTPKRPGGSNQPQFQGFTATAGFGVGFEVGEYGEVYTSVKEYARM